MTHCEYCIDIGSQVARKHGLSDDELLALPAYQDSSLCVRAPASRRVGGGRRGRALG